MSKHNEKYTDPWDRDYYETGSTRPPKDHGGLVAVLLVAVILLGGICSALGIINLRLLQQIAQGETQPETVHLFEEEQEHTKLPDPSVTFSEGRMPKLGMYGQTVSDFDRRFYDLPRGVLVTDVTEDRGAHLAGIRTGDVIISFNGESISSHEQLKLALEGCTQGQQVELELYRQQTRENIELKIKITEDEE